MLGNHNKRALKLVSLLTVVLMGMASAPVGAATYNDLQSAQNKAAENRKKITEGNAKKGQLNADIKTADAQMDTTQNELSALETELAQTRGERDKITAKLNELRVRLSVTQGDLDESLIERDRLSVILNERAGNVYKNGEISFLEVLLDANSFADFVHRAQFLKAIMGVDARLIKEIKAAKRKIELAKARIIKDEADVEKKETVLTAEVDRVAGLTGAVRTKKSQLQSQISSKETLISEIESDQEQWEAAAAAYERSAAQIRAQLSRSSAPTFVSGSPSASGFIWPAAGTLTSGFGARWGRMHNGIDIAVPTGAPVAASKAGRVAIASWYGGYGNLVVIDHGGGVSTWYGHNSAFTVKAGETVTRGQVVAKAGSTGNSTGPHVHFEIRFNGNPVNPRNYLR